MRFRHIFLCFFIISCNNLDYKKSKTIRVNNEIIKGEIINDTILNDTIYSYDLNSNLKRKEYFNHGKREGLSVEYYNNRPSRITAFSDGLRNGYSSYLDSFGRIYYKDYCYYDIVVGPIIYYNINEQPKKYFFVNLQNETLLEIEYQKWNGVKDIYSKCINFTANLQKRDTMREIGLLLYLINPPKFSFEYALFKRKVDKEDDFTELMKIKHDGPFVNIALPVLPINEQYAIGLNIYDSILNKNTIVYKDVPL